MYINGIEYNIRFYVDDEETQECGGITRGIADMRQKNEADFVFGMEKPPAGGYVP